MTGKRYFQKNETEIVQCVKHKQYLQFFSRASYHYAQNHKSICVRGDEVQDFLEVYFYKNYKKARDSVYEFFNTHVDIKPVHLMTHNLVVGSYGPKLFINTFEDGVTNYSCLEVTAKNGTPRYLKTEDDFRDWFKTCDKYVARGYETQGAAQFTGFRQVEGLPDAVKAVDARYKAARDEIKAEAKRREQEDLRNQLNTDDVVISAALKILKKRGNKITITEKGAK